MQGAGGRPQAPPPGRARGGARPGPPPPPAARAGGLAAAQWFSPIGYVVDTTRACLIAGAPPPTWQRALWFWCAMVALAALGALGSSRLHEPYREVL